MNIHENVTIPGALQTLQNLLRSGDDEGAKALIAELGISWASKAEQVDQTSLVVVVVEHKFSTRRYLWESFTTGPSYGSVSQTM